MNEDELLQGLFSVDDIFGAQAPAPNPATMVPEAQGMSVLDANRMQQILMGPEEMQPALQAEARRGQMAGGPEDLAPPEDLTPAEMARRWLRDQFFEAVGPETAARIRDPLAPQPETPLAADDSAAYGSAIEPLLQLTENEDGGVFRAETPPAEGGTSAATELVLAPDGGGVVVVPGVGQLRIPAAAMQSIDHLNNYISQWRARGLGGAGLSAVPGQEAIDQAAYERILRGYQALSQGQPGGAGRPLGRAVSEFSMTQDAGVRPETAALLQQTGQGALDAQHRQDMADLMVQAGETEKLNAEAAMQQQQALQAQAERDEVTRRVEERVAQFDRALEDVSAMRVDPEQFYGGVGGRITSTIAIALGQLGSLLTGGPNVALDMINRGIERNMAAQQTNIQAAHQGLAARGRALDQFREILGDEQAAQDATRASLMQAYLTQLNGMLSGLRGPAQAAGYQVRDALAAQAAAQAQAVRDRARFSLETTIRNEVRIPGTGDAAQAFGQMQQRDALITQERQRQQLEAQQQAAFEAQVPAGTPVMTLDPNEGVEEPPQRARQAPRLRAAAPAVRRQAPVPTAADPEALSDRTHELIEQSREVGGPESIGISGWQQTPGGEARLRAAMADPTAWREVSSAIASVNTINEMWPELARLYNDRRSETFDANLDVAMGRAFVREMRDEYRVALTGAGAGEAELARIDEVFPDPFSDRITTWAGMDSAMNQLWGTYAARMRSISNRMEARAGIRPRNLFSSQYRSRNALFNAFRDQQDQAAAVNQGRRIAGEVIRQVGGR